MRLRLSLGALALAAALAPATATPQGVDETCLLPLTKVDPATVNIAFPDDSALYYGANFVLTPGLRVRITGRYPHARYMSFNAYDPQLRPVAALNDQEIAPDRGSANPFLLGADRTRKAGRDYTVFIEGGPKPATPAPNTLYPAQTGEGAPNVAGLFLYRIYVPDRDTGETGGVGVPTATIEPTTSTDRPEPSACQDLVKPSVTGINELLAAASPPRPPASTGGQNPPSWRRFVNLLSSVAVNTAGSPSPAGVPLDDLGGSGGFLSNKDNDYVSAPINRGFGDVVVTRFRVPTTPDTRPGTPRMPGGQLRYWSLCQNDPATQRYIQCVNDDRAVVGDDGYATFVVSPAAQRPANATRECGVNWLPWGLNPRGLLILRHMLPVDFAASIQAAAVDREVDTMGAYFPVSRYLDGPAAYDTEVGCRPPAPAAGRRTACTSRRVIMITLPRGARAARRARVVVAGRARTVPVTRGGRVRVDLRRAPKGTYRVRVVVGGRTAATRTYRTCLRSTSR